MQPWLQIDFRIASLNARLRKTLLAAAFEDW
jgi:hypothetical protein